MKTEAERPAWRLRDVLIGVGVLIVWLLTVWFTANQVQGKLSPRAIQATSQAAGAAVLLLAFIFMRYRRRLESVGQVRSSLWLGIAIVVSLYVLQFAYAKLNSMPIEASMAQIRALDFASADWMLVWLSAVVLAPVSEELLFRHHLLQLVPAESSRRWALVGVAATSVAFAYLHQQYFQPSTLLLMFLLACTFGWLRLRSGRIAIPIGLHAVASIVALLLNQLR